MDQQITIEKTEQLTLDQSAQDEIVKYVIQTEKKGRDARAKYEKDWVECDRLYNCEVDEITDPELDWQSNLCLPWAYDAVESAYSYLHSTMIPRNDAIIDMKGRTNEDHAGVEVMEQYLEQAQERARFAEQFGRSLHQLLRKNHSCVKQYWRKDVRVSHQWQAIDTPEGQVERLIPTEQLVYNGVWSDVIDIDNFVFYPIHGDIHKSTQIHCTYRYLEDLKTAAQAKEAPYFNIDKLDSYMEESDKMVEEGKKTYQGVKIKEAWIHRIKINGKVYKNYVATIAADKILIRFQPNPLEGGGSPFIWTALMPDGDCNYGYGFLSRGKGILKAANYLFNQRMDEQKIKSYGAHVYWDDGEFNPYNVISRPGAMIRMSQDSVVNGNLRPLLQDYNHLQANLQEVYELKAEFESVTVPKVVKGLLESGDRTATEIQGAQNNASGKMHTMAFHLNENHLKPWNEGDYRLIYQQYKIGNKELIADIARTTQESTESITDPKTGEEIMLPRPLEEMIKDLPEILPLPEVDIKIVGYQNSIRKQETLQSLGQVIPQLAETPAGAFIKWDSVAESVFEASDQDKSRLLADVDERKQIEENQKQESEAIRQLQMQQEAHKMQLEQLKADRDFQIEQEKIRLQELELELKYGLETLRLESAARESTEKPDNLPTNKKSD